VSPVVVSILTDDLAVPVDQVAAVADGVPVTPIAVAPASTIGRTGEVVFVLDTSERLAPGGAFDLLKDAVASQIRALPAGTRVAVVAAGDLALVRQELTEDHEAAAVAVEDLRMGTTSALWDAVERAAGQFSDDTDRFRTVVTVSSSADASATSTSATAIASVLRAGAQAVALRYRGGEPGLNALVGEVGGATFGVDTDAQLAEVLSPAVDLARDRLVLTLPIDVAPGELVQVALTVAGVPANFSFSGGARFERVTSLAPIIPDHPFTVPVLGDLFSGRSGLYLALLLAVIGVGLGVWAVATFVVKSGEDIEGRLSRYTPGSQSDDEAGNAVSQSALYQRAVAVTENFARQRGVLHKTERLLEKANLPFRPAEALFIYGLVAFSTSVLSVVLLRSVLATLLVTALGVVGPILFLRFKVSRRQRKFEAQLPDALQLLAGTLRAGYSLPQGMEAVSHEIEDPMGVELRRVMTEARLGRELEEALQAAAERLDSPDFAWAVMAIGIQREVGGNLNELLMTVSDTMVARERLRGEVKTLTAEGKMSAIILGGLPPGLGFVMWLMNPEYVNKLFTESMGQALMGLAVLSATIGLLWMKKVITINV
jgi:tight adherence protein B